MATAPALRRGFALIELLATVVVAAVVATLLLLTVHDHRRLGRLGEDIGKLGRIGALTQQYAADNADQFWTFSWRGGVTYDTHWPELNFAPTDHLAQRNQAVYLLRSRAGRPDMPVPAAWLPQATFSHLVLAEHQNAALPDFDMISAADRHRLLWARDPRGFDLGHYQPAPPGVPGDPAAKRHPYGAGLIPPLAFVDRSPAPNRVYQAAGHNQYLVPSQAILRGAPLTGVEHPAHKVMMTDTNARHFGVAQPYITHDQSRFPALFVDGSARVAHAAESNPGWNPNAPTNCVTMLYNYQPGSWEPPTWSGLPTDPVIGRFRWTRAGIRGRDFAGPEVDPCLP